MIKDFSQQDLRHLGGESFDLIYIDASNSLADVLIDLALSWDLLKINGLVVLDDYLIGEHRQAPPISDTTKSLVEKYCTDGLQIN